MSCMQVLSCCTKLIINIIQYLKGEKSRCLPRTGVTNFSLNKIQQSFPRITSIICIRNHTLHIQYSTCFPSSGCMHLWSLPELEVPSHNQDFGTLQTKTAFHIISFPHLLSSQRALCLPLHLCKFSLSIQSSKAFYNSN